MKNSVKKLNEILDTNYLSNSSSDKRAAFELINTGSAQLGYYSGRGRFTSAHSASLSFISAMVEYKEYNDAPRGGVGGDKAKLIEINDKEVDRVYEMFQADKKEKENKSKQLQEDRKNKLKNIAKEKGFESVSALKRANEEIRKYNDERMDRAWENRELKFKSEFGRNYNGTSIKDRVSISRIELTFDCEFKSYLI